MRLLRLLLVAAVVGCCGCYTRWDETFRVDKKQPFDLYALHELLDAHPAGVRIIEDTLSALSEDTLTRSNYVFVGDYPYYDERTVTRLLDYVERGNTAFIASNYLPEDLAYHLFGDECFYGQFEEDQYYDPREIEIYRDTLEAYLLSAGRTYELVNIRYWNPSSVTMHVLDDRLLCDEAFDNEVLGTIDTVGANFVRLSWGKGNFYYHTNPILFTNWFVIDTAQYRYPEAALAVLNDGPVYWDTYSKRYRAPNVPNGQPRNYNGGRNLLEGNPALSYILEQRELSLAWFTLIAGVVLFVLLRGRRRQRVIPVIHRRENSSKEYIDTISRLIHEKGNHLALAQRELGTLRYHLRERYNIRWKEGLPPVEEIMKRTGLDEPTVTRALAEIRRVQGGRQLLEGDLLRFFRAIEPLYRGSSELTEA